MRYMKYGVLEQCKEFMIIKQRFSHGMLRYFQNQLEDYLNDQSEAHPAIVCWYEGAMSTEELISQCA